MLKADIKQWNTEVFGMIDQRIEKRNEEIMKFDILDEVLGLEEHEIIQRNEEQARLLYELKCKDNIPFQKVRCIWLKEGGANTSFFHRSINKRRKRNDIPGIMVNGVWIEEDVDVKKGILEFFKSHFKRQPVDMPIVSRLDHRIEKCRICSMWFKR
ncbi:hypothetical protein ACS0TY_004320 [Phlomoides rotata]